MNCALCDNILIEKINQYEIYYSYTSHSNTLLINFIRKVLNCDLNNSHLRYLCKQCYSIFDELDLAETTCSRLKKEIFERWTITDYKDLYKDISIQTDGTDTQIKLEEPPIQTEITLTKTEECTEVNEKKEKPYECAVCQKRFVSKSGMVLHCQRQHQAPPEEPIENTVRLECDVFIDEECHKSESESAESVEIKKTRKKKYSTSAGKPLKYSCPQCPKMWRTMGELRNHVATHSNLRPYICEMCGQAYKHKSALDIHVGMHNGINPFSCNYCHKAFTQKGALQRHLPIHTGEAPYQCDLCGKRFVHHTSFNMHTLAHTGQKSYKCNLCGLALLSGSHLKRHMRVHTGERPYACAHCGKRFAERYNLAAHQRLHEAGPSELVKRMHKCQVCGAGFNRRAKLEEHLSNNHNKISDNDQNRKWVGHFLSTM